MALFELEQTRRRRWRMHKIVIPGPQAQTLKTEASAGPLEPQRSALIVVDMQNYFLLPEGMNLTHARDVVPRINRIASAVRGAGGTVVFLRHTFAPSGPHAMPAWQLTDPQRTAMLAANLVEGAEGHAVHPELDMQSRDLLVNKYRPSAFITNSSDLEGALRLRHIDTLIVTGTMTNICCESTARDAQMLDYRVIFVADGTATANDDLHNATLLNLQYYFADVIMTEDVLRLVEGRASLAPGS
jgi:ureidoacrylate peracid hydrolase